jgi:hypothetical protein
MKRDEIHEVIRQINQMRSESHPEEQWIMDAVIDALESVIRDCENWAGGLGSRLQPETVAKVTQALRLLQGA